MTDDEFVADFEACRLSKDEFHHYDHVRMVFLYLRRYPPLEALSRFSSSLKRFAEAKGAPERYNETITWALFFIIRERMDRLAPAQEWNSFVANNPELCDWKNNILKKYYRVETLGSDLARRLFVFPDAT